MEPLSKAGAVAVASLLAAGAALAARPEKKIVLYGWDTGEASLETVLSNADKFADIWCEFLVDLGRLKAQSGVFFVKDAPRCPGELHHGEESADLRHAHK